MYSKRIYLDASRYCISRFIESYFSDCVMSDRDKKIIHSFYISMLYGQISLWLSTGATDDIVEIYDRLIELSDGMIAEMFRRVKKT